MKRLAFITCILSCVCGAFCLSASAAEVNSVAALYDFYGDGMLFRQNEIAVFSGTGKAGDEISCRLFDDIGAEIASGKTTVAENGTFEVEFTAPEGGYKKYTAVLYCGGNEFRRITDIVFGELWLSSGQSNMQMVLAITSGWQKIVETADYGSEWLRFLQVPLEPLISGEKAVPYNPCNNIEGAYWVKGGDANVGEVSAVSYYFAKELSEKLNMPVGVLSVSLGATPIRSWIPRDELVNNSETLKILKKYGQYISEKDWYKSERSYYTDMTGNYNAKVYPLRNFKIAGMIWYQGEADVSGASGHGEYSAYFNLMQKSYTELFKTEKNLPIIYTHLACFGYLINDAYLQDFNAELTEIQQQEPSSRAVTAISDVSLDFRLESASIHPITKEPIGKRMAESAMGLVYGENSPYTVSALTSHKIEGKYVYMTFENVGDGLICDGTELKDFAVCGKDGVYYAAKAEIISSDTVRVWNDDIPSPAAATYAFSQGNYRANLYSTKGGEKYMPVSPSVTKRLNGAFYYYDLPWADCEDEKFFRNASSENFTGRYKLWNTENCIYVIDKESAFSGDAGLSITSSKKNFGINENFAFYNEDHVISYCDVTRNWSKYGALRFMVRNTGKEDVTLKNVQIKVFNGLWLAPDLCGAGSASCVIPADGEWHLIEANLNKLYLSGNSKSFPLPSIAIKDIFGLYLNFEGEEGSTIQIDSFTLAPKASKNTPIYFDLISRTVNTVRTFFSAVVDLIKINISGGYSESGINPTPEIYWSGTENEADDNLVSLTGPYADSIMYARDMENDVQVNIKDQASGDVVIENDRGKMILGILDTGNKQVLSLQNRKGDAYIANTMDVYVRNTAGETYFASDSPVAGRLNIYRYGYYYYNTHILDQIFADENYAKKTDLNARSLTNTGSLGNGMKNSDVSFIKASEGCAFKVVSAEDPYVGFRKLKYNAADYDAVEVVLRAEASRVGYLYLAAGDETSANESQRVSFNITPGSEFHTYVLPISSLPGYTGKINSLRLDIGDLEGELVEIKSFSLVKFNSAVPALALDRTVHAYADKLNQETHLVTTADVSNLAAYGMKTQITADTVAAMIAKDKNGTHTSLDDVDMSTLEYIGFDIKGVGVFGYIKTLDEGGTLAVTSDNAFYTVIQEVAAKEEGYEAGTHLYMGTSLYTDETHSFENFLYAAYCERNPLTVTVTNDRDGGRAVGYDSLRGAYCVEIDGSLGFQYNYENKLRRTVSIEVTGDESDRKIYMYTHTGNDGCLESAVLLDGQNRLLPISMEVCKNFNFEKEEPLFVPNDDFFGEAYFPFVVKSGVANNFSVVNLYQDWGRYPLKQLSSISFTSPYYHLSTGVTESNCIANYLLVSSNLLPDCRAMSQRFWEDQPQHTNSGILNFLSYTDAGGNYSAMRHKEDNILSYGPTYADVEMNYASYDGKIDVYLEHTEMPQTDENRTYYTYKVKVNKDISISDFKKNFTLFTMSGSSITYRKLGYLNENNESEIIEASTSSAPRYTKLGKESPYYDLFLGSEVIGTDGYTNLAVLVRDYTITIGGKAYEGNLVLRESLSAGLNRADLTLDLDNVTLKAGDEMTFHMILMPWGEGQTGSESQNDDNVRRVRMDSCLDPFKIDVTTGTELEHPFVPMALAENNTAEFTVSGGSHDAVFYTGLRENRDKVRGLAVRLYGFDAVGVPVVEELVNGVWNRQTLSSDVYAYDGYNVYYEGDGTYSYSFIIDMSKAVSRTYRVTLDTSDTIFSDVELIPSRLSDNFVYDGISYSAACELYLPKMSFDTLFKNGGIMYQNQEGLANIYLTNNPITLDDTWKSFLMIGWAGYESEKIIGYGYRLNDGELITDPSFIRPAEQGVLDAGGQSRYYITIPITDTTKTTLVRTYILLEDGTSVEMTRFWALGADK